jgi:hypothetical protein
MTPQEFATLKDCIDSEIIKESDPNFGSILAYAARHIELRKLARYASDYNEDLEAQLLLLSIRALSKCKVQVEPVADWQAIESHQITLNIDSKISANRFDLDYIFELSLLLESLVIEHLEKNGITKIESDCFASNWRTEVVSRKPEIHQLTIYLRYKKLN